MTERVIALVGGVSPQALAQVEPGHRLRYLGPSRPAELPAEADFHACDPLSLDELTRALGGVERVIHGVGAEPPRARMVQGSLADFEVLAMDNVLRAAAACGVERVSTLRVRPAARGGQGARASTVQSLQRLPLPEGWDALDAALEYVAWLGEALPGLLRIEQEGGRYGMVPLGFPAPALELTLDASATAPGRAVFRVTGGLLAGGEAGARLEFRKIAGDSRVFTAVQDFVPALPWAIYAVTQAPIHLGVMLAFGRHLRRKRRGAREGAAREAVAR